jgi:hypothetical protein
MQNGTSHNQAQLERVKILQAKLDKAVRLHRLYKSEDCQQVLLPALKEASQIQWLDPADPNFQLNYQLAYSKAKAYKEILNLLESAEGIMNRTRLELGQPEKNFQTGT